MKRANRFQSVFPYFAASTHYSVEKGQHMSQLNKHCKLSFNALIESGLKNGS